jgi:endonuclease YncB( thermonuclease family)
LDRLQPADRGRALQRARQIVIAGVLAGLACACGREAAAPAAEGRAGPVWSGVGFAVNDTAAGPGGVVLAGVTAPDADRHPTAAEAARRALADHLEAGEGRVLVRPAAEPERDRYDRLIAAVETPEGDLAERLVRDGWLIVWPRAGQNAAFDALYAAEAEARRTGAGGWGEGAFTLDDPDPNRLAQKLDGPVIVEGLVVDTGTARDGRVFVNFGLDWRTDFTATADRDAHDAFESAGLDLTALEGARVRVRGWLYETNGPAISLSHPAQLELVDAPEPRTLR